MARSTRPQGRDDQRSHTSGCDQKKTCTRVIACRLVLRWKETDTGFKDLDIHEVEHNSPLSEVSPINITLQILASTSPEGTSADGESCKATCVPETNRSMSPRLPKSCRVLEGAPIRVDRAVCGLICGMSGWRSRIVFQLKEKLRDERVRRLCIGRSGRSIDGKSRKSSLR